MSNSKQAFDDIRTACRALEEARNGLSAVLLDHASEEGKRASGYAELRDLHRRVAQAAALLPNGGDLR